MRWSAVCLQLALVENSLAISQILYQLTQAVGGTVKIRVNQIKVWDKMRHPVFTYLSQGPLFQPKSKFVWLDCIVQYKE